MNCKMNLRELQDMNDRVCAHCGVCIRARVTKYANREWTARIECECASTTVLRKAKYRAVQDALNAREASFSIGTLSTTTNTSIAASARVLGHYGGALGGKARAEKLSPERRTEIARIAANKRWEGKGNVGKTQKNFKAFKRRVIAYCLAHLPGNDVVHLMATARCLQEIIASSRRNEELKAWVEENVPKDDLV